MDEYIKREDAIKAIAYNGLDKDNPTSLVDIALIVAQAKIMGIPAADVVEVCRCEDCAFAKENATTEDFNYYDCALYRDMRKGSDFCDYGKRNKP